MAVQKNKGKNQVRIIGGRWRGSKILLPSTAEHLRPTTDRIRETVFNWLAPYVDGARCLDCFAGSGALGFEALSRGASDVLLIDQDPRVCTALRQNVTRLKMDKCIVRQGSVPTIQLDETPFNIIFLDPPYLKNLLMPSLQWLQDQTLLAKNAVVYFETEVNLDIDLIPAGFEIIKHKTTKQIQYGLLAY